MRGGRGGGRRGSRVRTKQQQRLGVKRGAEPQDADGDEVVRVARSSDTDAHSGCVCAFVFVFGVVSWRGGGWCWC